MVVVGTIMSAMIGAAAMPKAILLSLAKLNASIGDAVADENPADNLSAIGN